MTLRSRLGLSFGAVLLALGLGGDAGARPPEGLFVRYDHAGLTQLAFEGGQLRCTWHVARRFDPDEPAHARQDMSSYDRYECELWLTQSEREAFLAWLKEHDPFAFERRYEPKEEGRREYETRLEVSDGTRTRRVEWASSSELPPAVRKAEEALLALGKSVRAARAESSR